MQPALEDGIYDLPDEGIISRRASDELARNFRALWSTFYRNRLLVAAICAAAVFIGLGVTMLMTPKFRAVATVQIDQQSTQVLDSDSSVDPTPAWQDADRFLQTQIDVLQSRALAIDVMQDLNLLVNDNFVIEMGEKPADQPLGSLSLADTKREQVVRILEDNLKVNLPRSSRVVEIDFDSPNPRLAARIANAFASDFMMFNMKKKFESSSYARDFLQTQLAETKTRLEASERALLAYARSVGLLDVSGGIEQAGTDGTDATSTPRSLVTSNLVQLNQAYATAQAARVAAQERWEQAQATPPLQLADVLTNPAIMQLSQLKAQAQALYQQDLQRHKPDYPQMQQAAAHIAELDRQINSLAGSIRLSIKEPYQASLKQEQALLGQVNQFKTQTQSEQDRSIEYNILKREVDTNRLMYDGLLERFKQVSAEAGVAANNISQVDTADVPAKPVSPRALINVGIAGLLGLILASAFVLLREKFDDSVRTPEDVPTKLGLTFLNSTPLLEENETPAEQLDDPRSSLSEAYAALRTAIELSDKHGAPRTLSVTSTRQSEGKSTTAFAIARSFAKIGRKVILIDGDLRKPSMHRLVNVGNEVGFSNLLARLRTIDEVIQQTDTPNLSLIAAGPLPPNPAELLSGPSLPEIIQQISTRCDVVVIDAPPVLGLADTVLIGAAIDAMLFVIEANGAHHGHAKAAVRRLTASGVNMIGALLTKYDARKIGYGYGYGYNYTYSYSYGSNEPEPKRRFWPFGKK
jgi:capsular exopolysaccharide synthesis family protein